MQIALVNQSTVLSDAEVAVAAGALSLQASRDVLAGWGVSATVFPSVRGQAIPPGAAQVLLLDDSDQPGALGYHDVTPGGMPVAKVFARTDKTDGLSWTVTASHEIVEMIVDPDCTRAEQIGPAAFGALEACDPCEADRYGYWIGQTLVSDFILPAWFHPRSKGPFDFGRHITRALSLLPGGYASTWTASAGWTQKHAALIEGVKSRRGRGGRLAFRGEHGFIGASPDELTERRSL